MLRNWYLTLVLERAAGVPLHLQLVQAIIQEIQRGRLLPGTALPGSRTIAEALALNRKTVVQAYDELLAQGWIETEARRGAFVSTRLPLQQEGNDDPASVQLPSSFARALPENNAMPYGDLAANVAGVIRFSDGVPDARLVPFDVLSRAYRHALVFSARANRLAYDDPRGNSLLRVAIADMLRAERGMGVTEAQICVVRGSQMGIYLSARLLAASDGCVVMEDLSYPPAREAFASFGIALEYIPQDNSGMDLDALAALCARRKVSAIYTTPHHQFPTTVMLSVERRIRLLELARQHDFVIIEDDYDHEFHFSHSPMLPLASMDTDGRVIHIGSLSKVLAPGLRLGYIAAPETVINRCMRDIILIDRQGNSLTELAVAELMRTGEIKRHVRRSLKIYKERRDYAVTRVREMIPSAVFTIPPGGLALWLELDARMDMQQLQRDALVQGVAILTGQLFSGTGSAIPALRLGYASLDQQELDKGLAGLALAIEQQIGA
ncbi:MAG: PLP-dependent aminotransferase family protein [Cellvibrio sp.]|uniref:MocR-like pyridoxine biosynthesis transcription factor PdxR n=1 Tax=Cellvibrio sp. TaxID=1965322 RepID=UPI0031AE6DD3